MPIHIESPDEPDGCGSGLLAAQSLLQFPDAGLGGQAGRALAGQGGVAACIPAKAGTT